MHTSVTQSCISFAFVHLLHIRLPAPWPANLLLAGLADVPDGFFKTDEEQSSCTSFSQGNGDLCVEQPTVVACDGSSGVGAYLPSYCGMHCAAARCRAEQSCVGFTETVGFGLQGSFKLKSVSRGE